ncbi:hypothetical protein A3I56_00075 [Candidatus Roizmanbacteria bacterium RIFCSPLOWO2_02_FULL_43_10]|uniref:Big-1 domain-containing protein n=1 Tax=Candidatus Roizmanbacteria bacterium RIFCSPLOWO2_02_FULL_43_10 TaxID=1802078 RepID=A0A1F7JVE4_9BACT|nr:MAG: hypothetical protein A3I56_00075 [Candidatus Roizmanbacteria bacterium RIFCSPLOWO2_02_FULL_43_10]
MRRTLMLIGFLLLLLVPLIFLYMVSERQMFVLKSRASFQEVSGSNSLAIATPSCVKAGGEEITRLNIYCLNNQGLGVENMPVTVSPASTAQALGIRAIQGTTDTVGKAVFDITSGAAGIFELTIDCGTYRIKTAQKVCFEP